MIHDNVDKEFNHVISMLDAMDRCKDENGAYTPSILEHMGAIEDMVRAYSLMLNDIKMRS
jgi:hypothetical protein